MKTYLSKINGNVWIVRNGRSTSIDVSNGTIFTVDDDCTLYEKEFDLINSDKREVVFGNDIVETASVRKPGKYKK